MYALSLATAVGLCLAGVGTILPEPVTLTGPASSAFVTLPDGAVTTTPFQLRVLSGYTRGPVANGSADFVLTTAALETSLSPQWALDFAISAPTLISDASSAMLSRVALRGRYMPSALSTDHFRIGFSATAAYLLFLKSDPPAHGGGDGQLGAFIGGSARRLRWAAEIAVRVTSPLAQVSPPWVRGVGGLAVGVNLPLNTQLSAEGRVQATTNAWQILGTLGLSAQLALNVRAHLALIAEGGSDRATSIGGLAGVSGAFGGTDVDGDGVPNADDACPNVSGVNEYQGCPIEDTDQDGTWDKLDVCPEQPGPVENAGCP